MSRISSVEVIPLAFADPPLLNTWGAHEPLALRTLVILTLSDGTVGLGEAGGDIALLERLRAIGPRLVGGRVDDPLCVTETVASVLSPDLPTVQKNLAAAPFEVAVADAWARLEDVPLVELLGGAIRPRVEYSGYLFYKWSGHPGLAPDRWGEVLDAAGVRRLGRAFTDEFGFSSLKLKAGVFAPAEEVASIRALAEEVPDALLRIDPNGAWHENTAIQVAQELEEVLDYLEDPVLGIDAMARVRAATTLPLASNMIVNSRQDLDDVVAAEALDIVLADHHYWGGPRKTLALADECVAAGLAVSMHSNSHLGVSLAAMTHVGAASRALTYASDTHYPWNAQDDIVDREALTFVDGGLPVPSGPGLGVELRRDVVDRLHRAYIASGRTARDDTSYMRTVEPDFDATLPRF